MVTRRHRRPTPNRKTQTNGPQPSSNRFVGLDNIEPKTNNLVHVNGASTSSIDLTPIGPHISNTQQHINTNIRIPNHSFGPVHSQENPSSHVPSVPHVHPLVDITDRNTTGNSHLETSPTLIPEKPSLKESLSVSPEIPKEELKVDFSPAPSPNPLNSYHTSSLRIEKSKARKPPNLPNRYGERGNSPTNSVYSQDGGRSTGVVDRARDRSHSPRRHHLVDQTTPHENRTRMEQNPRTSSPFHPDGIHEIH